MSTWLIQAKIVEKPEQDIQLSDLMISFNETFKDYVIYFPGTTDQYITRIGDVELGFGPRYLLKKLLFDVKKVNPSGKINTSYIEVRTIPHLDEPLMRRLGSADKPDVIVIQDPELDKVFTTIQHPANDPGQNDNTETGNSINYVVPNNGTATQLK